jgi:alkaline phosphatase D
MAHSRRSLLATSALGVLTLPVASRLSFAQAPAIVTSDALRPRVNHGVMSGDVAGGRAIVWSRTDRPARMIVEYDTTESLRDPRRIVGPHATEVSDFTSRVDLADLPAGQEIFYRVTYQDLGDLRTMSIPATGRLRTAPADRRTITFQWSGDTAGQGYGINPEWGGMRIYEQMRLAQPDFFIHCGDTIYADGPMAAERPVLASEGGGPVWRNIITPEKAKVAETLDEFRGNYRYNLMDANVRRFHAEVPQIWQWDDHEVTNNWSVSKDLSADARYSEKRIGILTGRASRAFLDYAPLRQSQDESERVYRHIPYGPLLDVFVIDMRSYRGPNSFNRQDRASHETAFLGRDQLRWLKQGLFASRARWKVIAADMPIGLLVGDGKDDQGRDRFENGANGDGPPLGREMEIADLLRSLKANGVKNVVWVTADTHYTAAHFYDPAKAVFTDFDPFWEFMSGPLNSGTFGPSTLDNTFGIQVVYQKHPPAGQANLPPSAGMQFYGEIKIDGASEAMNVALKDVAGATLWSRTLEPQRS